MKVWNLFLTRTYLRRILITISLLLILSVLIASLALSYNFERTALTVRHKANMDVLSQMSYNVTYLNDSLKMLANNLYYDIDVQFLRYAKGSEADNYQLIRSLGKLDYTISSSPFLHSIFIYNGNQNNYYVGNGKIRANPDIMEAELNQLLQAQHLLPKMSLLPISLDNSSDEGYSGVVDFFAMVMYDLSNSNRMEDAIILNIKPQWLFDNISMLNHAAGAEGSTIHLLDGSMQPLNPDPLIPINMEEISSELSQSKLEYSNQRSGYFITRNGQNKVVVSYARAGVNDWTLITIQPYEAILRDIQSMRMTTLWITGCVVLLFLMIAFVASRRLYAPINSVLGKFSSSEVYTGAANLGIRDEMTYLSDAYSSILERIRHANLEVTQRRSAVKMYHLKRLIQNSALMTEEEFKSITKDNNLQIGTQDCYYLAVVKLDRFAMAAGQAEAGDLKLIQFAVTNIAEDLVRTAGFHCEVIEMRTDHWVVLSGPKEQAGDEMEQWNQFGEVLRQVQSAVKNYYKLTITVAVTPSFESYSLIAARYNDALILASYRILFGYNSLIVPSMVAENMDNREFDVPLELEKRMVELMRSADMPKLAEQLNKYMTYIARFNYEHVIHALLHLVIIIRQTVQDMNRNRLQPMTVDLSDLNRSVLTLETLDEIKLKFLAVFTELLEPAGEETDKGRVLIDAIREIVDAQFADLNLSLQGIAAMLKMSPVYVGRIFKRAEGLSVAEYINDRRLAEAERKLLLTDNSIGEIMEQTGFSNQSQFFKLFKKKYGTTPKEYRLANVIRDMM
ncbi:helix-turn-helix domain-containing protein [Paenibacillus sp. GCM10023252]|uniref:helix-turn-helix domain-containing protein n=1 Tax=Paenibacillus sp. GCM10023252 TaxID=3252649 RepID=UPI003622A203